MSLLGWRGRERTGIGGNRQVSRRVTAYSMSHAGVRTVADGSFDARTDGRRAKTRTLREAPGTRSRHRRTVREEKLQDGTPELGWHPEGQGFGSPQLHYSSPSNTGNFLCWQIVAHKKLGAKARTVCELQMMKATPGLAAGCSACRWPPAAPYDSAWRQAGHLVTGSRAA